MKGVNKIQKNEKSFLNYSTAEGWRWGSVKSKDSIFQRLLSNLIHIHVLKVSCIHRGESPKNKRNGRLKGGSIQENLGAKQKSVQIEKRNLKLGMVAKVKAGRCPWVWVQSDLQSESGMARAAQRNHVLYIYKKRKEGRMKERRTEGNKRKKTFCQLILLESLNRGNVIVN